MPRSDRKPQQKGPDRPPIWVDGRQSPRFDLAAWASVGQRMARRWLVPRLERGAGTLGALAAMIAAGRYSVPLGRLGRFSRIVPSRFAVGASVAGLAARLLDARHILSPPVPASEPMPPPNLIRPDFTQRPARPLPVHPADTPPDPLQMPRNPIRQDPDLRAIRAIIREEARPVSQVPNPVALHSAGLPARLAAHAIAWAGLGLTLPLGLVQATLFHLNGGDLTDWD